MNEIIMEYLSERGFSFAFRMFLDEFYRSDGRRKQSLVLEPIIDEVGENNAAFAAGAVHRLCRKHGLQIPRWVFDDKYYLKKPYFLGPLGGSLQLYMFYYSPPEFKSRNVFTGESILSRT